MPLGWFAARPLDLPAAHGLAGAAMSGAVGRGSKVWVVLVLTAFTAVVCAGCGDNEITAALTPTGTPAATATLSRSPTQGVTPSPQITLPSETPRTPTSTATLSATPVASATATFTATPTFTATATSTATLPATPTATQGPATALFSLDADNPDNPFPSDRLRDEAGRVRVPAPYLRIALPDTAEFAAARAFGEAIASQLQVLTGFSTFAPIRVRFDRPVVVDAGSFPRGIWLLRADELDDPPHWIQASYYDPDRALEIYPVVPLRPKTPYALVVTDDLVDSRGYHVQPSEDFVRLREGIGLDAAAQAWRDRLLPIWDYVERRLEIRRSEIVLTELFTTQPTWDDLVAIRQRLDAGALPEALPVLDRPLGDLRTGIFPEGTPEFESLVGAANTANVAAAAVGFFDSFDFRDRPNGAFDPSKIAGEATPSPNKVDFYMALPKATPPPNGYPVAVFGHGLGGSGRDVYQIARLNLHIPMVGIAISALQHGRRGSVTNFFNLTSITTTREFFRQTIADFMQLVRMIRRAHAARIAPFDTVDPERIVYIGGSLGGIMGTMFMAVENQVLVGMLSVPGGGLPNILASRQIGQLLEPFLGVLIGLQPSSPFFEPFLHRFRQVAQWALDPADPINYAPYVVVPGAQLPGVPPKRILMHEGIVDDVVPNRTTEDLALAMRLPDLNATRGCLRASGCSGIWRFVMTDYGRDELSGHTVTVDVAEATRQAFAFLLSDGTWIPDASPGAEIDLDAPPLPLQWLVTSEVGAELGIQ